MASRLDVVRKMLEAGGQSQARVADFIQAAGADPAMAARLTEAAQSGDYRAILREMSEQQWGRSPAVPQAEAPVPTGSRSPMPFEQRVARDPEIRRTIEEAGIPAALRAGVEAGDPEAIMAAYRGAGRAEDSIRKLRKPPDQVAAEGIASQFDRATGAVPERQMELPLSDAPTGLIPYGVRGPGVPGDLRGPGVPVNPGTDLIPSPPRRIGGQTRELSVPAERPYRVVDEVKPKNNRLAKAAAAAALTGGAAYWALRNAGDIGRKSTAEESAVESGGAADLAAETSPPPAIAATPDVPEPTVVQAPQDYSLQARALINRLNDMRRAAGGEVPEAPAMMKEINRLLALGNQTRRATMVAAPQDDAGRLYQQAQALIDQVNQMYRQGMKPNSPQVQRVMAQVRQLQSQGDAMRNRRAG